MKKDVKQNGLTVPTPQRSNKSKQSASQEVMTYCLSATPSTFSVKHLLHLFWHEPKLKRYLSKIYEIVVYALFVTISDVLKSSKAQRNKSARNAILDDFEDITNAVMRLDLKHSVCEQPAKVFRVGVTNAADRGIDMYANWGPAIQIKHLTLDESMAENIVAGISSDRIIIVCKAVEQAVLLSLLTQLGWKSRIQSVITEETLVAWYEKASKGKHADLLGNKLLGCLVEEIEKEFPSSGGVSPSIQSRRYEKIKLFPPWS